MRILTTNLLAAAVLLFGATSASAFYNIEMSARPGSSLTSLTTSDTVTVDVFFGTDQPQMQQLAIGVVTPDTMTYDPAASLALPVIYPAPAAVYGTTGAQPGYLLYGSVGKASVALYAVQNPPIAWPTPDPGTTKTNINFQVASLLTPTPATGSNIWVASMVFHVDSGFSGGSIALQMSGLGSVLRNNNVVIDPSLMNISAPLELTAAVPEPTTAAMIGLGILGLALAGRRK